MKLLAELIIAAADLLEAEVRFIQRSVWRIVIVASALFTASLLLIGGIGLLCFALYKQLIYAGMSQAGAAMVGGLIMLAAVIPTAGVALWLAHRR